AAATLMRLDALTLSRMTSCALLMIAQGGIMTRIAWLVLAILMVMSPTGGMAGPAEDANATVDRWSAAYSGNDPDTVSRSYWPDAVLLGTVSPIMSEGREAIRTYFSPLKDSGNKNAIGERRTFVLSD